MSCSRSPRWRALVLSAAFASIVMSCQTTELPSGSLSLGLQLAAQGLTAPVKLISPPDGSGRRFVVDQVGLIRIILPNGTLLDDPFLDLRSRMVTLSSVYDERGLLGLSFHPDYANNRRLYVYYSAPRADPTPVSFSHESHLSEFLATVANPNLADPDTERVLLRIPEPQGNHNGGDLAFGPDDMLYVAVGDGGAANDVGTGHTPGLGNGQDKTTLLGKILRIDVDGGDPYGVPGDNPFVDEAGTLPEIWALGFRNPYRFSFDAGGTHALFVGDVGQNLREEVDIVTPGGNYGWNVREGNNCFDPDAPNSPPAGCPTVDADGDPLIAPIFDYPRPGSGPAVTGVAIAGGYVYRGSAVPTLSGRYLFGDWSQSFSAADGRVFVATESGGTWTVQEPTLSGLPGPRLSAFVLGIGQDSANELYVLTSQNLGPSGSTGRVYKVVAGGG